MKNSHPADNLHSYIATRAVDKDYAFLKKDCFINDEVNR